MEQTRARFPFESFPEGWFVVAFSTDIAPAAVKTVHYFGVDLVLYRMADGALTAADAHCPHLGAHLGDGTIKDGCLRCPFHDWAFDSTGACVDVPYAPKIPPKAKLRTWPLLEQNGVVMVHYSARGRAPTWTPPPLPEDGWTANRTIRWELASHPQEVAENTVDCSHLAPVHHVIKTEILEVEQRDHVMRVLLHLFATGQVIGMPDEQNDVHLDVTLHGLGVIVSSTHVLTAGLKTRQRIHPTPIDRDRIAIFAVANTMHMPDPGYTAQIDQIFWEAFVADFSRDFPIWEKKAYLDKPLLAGGDGPIGSYRKWCRQFYTAGDGATTTTAASAKPSLRDRVVEQARALGEELRARLQSTPRPTRSLAQATRRSTKPGPRFPSVDAYFDSLEARFNAGAAGELSAVFQWILTDDPERAVFAKVEGGRIEKAAGVHTSPTITIEMTTADYLRMINGELNGALAFSTGRGRLSGPVALAMRMQRIFPLDGPLDAVAPLQ